MVKQRGKAGSVIVPLSCAYYVNREPDSAGLDFQEFQDELAYTLPNRKKYLELFFFFSIYFNLPNACIQCYGLSCLMAVMYYSYIPGAICSGAGGMPVSCYGLSDIVESSFVCHTLCVCACVRGCWERCVLHVTGTLGSVHLRWPRTSSMCAGLRTPCLNMVFLC